MVFCIRLVYVGSPHLTILMNIRIYEQKNKDYINNFSIGKKRLCDIWCIRYLFCVWASKRVWWKKKVCICLFRLVRSWIEYVIIKFLWDSYANNRSTNIKVYHIHHQRTDQIWMSMNQHIEQYIGTCSHGTKCILPLSIELKDSRHYKVKKHPIPVKITIKVEKFYNW